MGNFHVRVKVYVYMYVYTHTYTHTHTYQEVFGKNLRKMSYFNFLFIYLILRLHKSKEDVCIRSSRYLEP